MHICIHIHNLGLYIHDYKNTVYKHTLAHSLVLPLLPTILSSQKAQRLIYRLVLAKFNNSFHIKS